MRSNAWLEYALAVLAACSLEAAWITLAYVTVAAMATDAPGPLPTLAFAGATLAGLGYARWSAQDGRRAYKTPLALIAVAAAMAGWLLPLGPAVAHVLDEPLEVVGMHPGGILLGLAVLRGTAHVTPDDDERIADTALGPGLIGVAAIWAILTATGASRQSWVVEVAFVATVTYVTAGLLSLGLARLAGLRSAAVIGADRRTWVVLLGIVAGLLAVAMPLALILGVPLDHAIRGVLGPAGDLLVPVVTLLLLPFALLATVLVVLFELLTGGPGTLPDVPAAIAATLDFDWVNAIGRPGAQGPILELVPLVVAVVAAFLLMRGLLGRPDLSEPDDDATEIRQTERPVGGVRLPRPHLPKPRRRLVPHTASEAYLASLEILTQWPESARLASETPAEHVRRLRADPIGLPLSRLAADYALAEFGQRTLAPSEHRRAIERWRRLRSVRDR
jgi:hypothetical protein